ncbi:hypothetical protein CFH99_01185 [Nocardioides aromaticivorans]|uniref:Secreted protein n=1 Tax=Nocardioides aromaticivorans TaxID=200618 RepID=A0ABX7PEJ6_9ACTN|nr:hypothetical protein [Nocardioides aromaticivorans]QSR24237.1 hypothetical protein CFH99_01185 [Nocardioides aromaticivorans]
MFNRKTAIALALALGAFSVTACSEDSKDQPAGRDASSASEESRTPSGDNGDLTDPVGARADLTGFRCAPKGQRRWTASGTLMNPTDHEARYLVRVSVVVTETSEVIASGERDLAVPAGGSEDFAVGRLRGRTGAGVECVARVVRSAPL